MKRVAIGVIGATGGIGRARCAHFAGHEHACLVAVCSRTRSKAEALGRAFTATAYDDWRDLVADPAVAAVSIASVNTTHYEIAKAALAAGKHVCVEYPMTQTLEQYDALLGLAREHGVVLHDGLNIRQEPLHVVMRENMGRIGKPVAAHHRYIGGPWPMSGEARGKLFLALHIQLVDQQVDLLGEVAWVEAVQQEDIGGQNCMFGAITLGFVSGATGYAEFGMGFPCCPGRVAMVLGSDGMIEYAAERVAVTTRNAKDAIPMPADCALEQDSHNFIEQIVSGAKPFCPPERGRRAIEICLAATRSATEQRRVYV